VESDKFASFATFHNYVASTYTQALTDQLFGPWQMDEALYKDVNGVFCSNADLGAGAVTDVSWDGYTFTFEQISDTEISIDVTVTLYTGDDGEDQTGDYQSEPFHVHGTATLENGRWLLEHMMVDGDLGI